MAISYTHVLWGRLFQLVRRPIRLIDIAEEQYDSKQKIKKQICHFQLSVKLSQKELDLIQHLSEYRKIWSNYWMLLRSMFIRDFFFKLILPFSGLKWKMSCSQTDILFEEFFHVKKLFAGCVILKKKTVKNTLNIHFSFQFAWANCCQPIASTKVLVLHAASNIVVWQSSSATTNVSFSSFQRRFPNMFSVFVWVFSFWRVEPFHLCIN